MHDGDGVGGEAGGTDNYATDRQASGTDNCETDRQASGADGRETDRQASGADGRETDRQAAGRELLLELDREGPLPIHEQIERSLREQIRSGRLRAGERLPSTRGLATALGVSRGVVTEAYSQLAAEGYLVTSQGAPVKVAATARSPAPTPPPPSLLPEHAYDMRPTLPDLSSFPHDRWLRSLRSALRLSPLSALDYPDPRGVEELREALAGYLGRVRGAAAEPEHMLICTGFSQGLSMLCRAMVTVGVRCIAIEDPGWHPARLIAERAGMETIPVPVDEQGIVVDALSRTDAAVVLVTPAHQFPTGAILSPSRRAELIEWAETGDRLIVEDDYDGELHHGRAAVGALQGLAPERVLYAGSASKRLAPGLRLGWLLTPSWLSWQLISEKAVEDCGSEVLGQLTLADFLSRGELDRHLRRMRLSYARRRAALVQALERRLPQARPSGRPGGLFEPVSLPGWIDEAALIAAAAERGVGVEGLSLHSFSDESSRGLVLGYGGLGEPALDRAVHLLAQAFAQFDMSAGSW